MKKIVLFLLLIISLFGLLSCKKGNETANGIHTDLQQQYLSGDPTKATDYADGQKELSIPKPYLLSWSDSGDYIIKIEEKDSKKSISYNVSGTSTEVYNLKTNMVYNWYLNDELKGEISVPQGLRNLYIDGLTNCRDIGGYKIDSGYTNQGLLIRTSKLTADETGEVLITAKGIEAIKQLGIKTELDLRSVSEEDGKTEQGGITKSAVDGVNYISFPMASGGNYLQLNRKVLAELFAILGDESNYPIVFHCSIGTDRTGVVAFLINALLGVSKEDLYRDYLFSNFGLIYGMRNPSTIDDYINKVTSDETKTLAENTRAYLIRQGVSEENIDNVIRIMTK